MASKQEAEIVFAQKLASNEKPIRSKAIRKLRKYIIVRSEREQGGFTEEELLKIWKGLFYCLWMQDLPLLQEELSRKISGLLHSFRTVDSKFLFIKTFLQTMKREWNGIDRLRMDKFYQCVRFVFREVFEMLKRQDWQPSLVNDFSELISAQLFQNSSSAPSGLILHVLDVYLDELALVGSAVLTAEQNLTFIEPFCKAMSKNKNRVVLKAIKGSIFNTIVDQVPFAVEDLLREIGQDKSGSKSEEISTDQMKDDDHDEDDSDVEEDLSDDMNVKVDSLCGPVLQFDYGAIADRLFHLASYTNIPSFNRSKVYKIVKIFRDLSEGVFPQDDVEVVSSDDEDEDDNRRRKKKKRLNNQSSQKTDEAETMNSESSQDKKKKRKKRRLKKENNQMESDNDKLTEKIETLDVISPESQTTKKRKKDLQVKEEKSQDMISIIDPLKEQQDSSDLTSEIKHQINKSLGESDENVSVVPSEQKKKKRKLKKTKSETSDQDIKDEMDIKEINTSTDVSTETTTQKKKKIKKITTNNNKEKTENKMMKKAVKSEDPETENYKDSSLTSMNNHTDDIETQSHENTKTLNKKKKLKKKEEKSVEVNGEVNKCVKRKRNLMNGHTDTEIVKKPKISKESEKTTKIDKKIKIKGFGFSPKKSPKAIFCKSSALLTPVSKKQGLKSPKSEMKKVTFGLKNNKTMEFRKMDKSSLLSPAGQSRVAFDPKKTPKSGVLKSPSSSPAIQRRSTAADFF